MLRKKLFILPLFAFFVFVSCENSVNNQADQPVNAEPTKEIVVNEAQNVAVLAFTGPVATYEGYYKIMEMDDNEGLGKVAGDDVYRWNPNTGWHTWEDDLSNPAYPDAFFGHYTRGQQFFNAQGQIVKKARDAVGLNFYYTTSGHFGYVNDEPTGTSWDHGVDGSAAIVSQTMYFTGSGQYHKIWDGYYTSPDGTFDNDLVRFETIVNVNIEELVVSKDENGEKTAILYGDLTFEMLPWSAELSADGSDTVTGVLKNNGQVVQELSYDVVALLEIAQALKP